MFRSGRFVSQHVSPIVDEQVQPNGVDITVDRVERPLGGGHIARDGKTIGEREAIQPTNGCFELEPGTYVVGYGERLRVPNEHVGYLLPRSSLLRNGTTVHTAVWDTGYEGRGEGMLAVGAPIAIDVGARIAQFVLAAADHAGVYDGAYQGERLE
ncbi:MAG: deoxyuridine 5'-triphosphate nucleotidohydrolase [Halobacteriota archaeon]